MEKNLTKLLAKDDRAMSPTAVGALVAALRGLLPPDSSLVTA